MSVSQQSYEESALQIRRLRRVRAIVRRFSFRGPAPIEFACEFADKKHEHVLVQGVLRTLDSAIAEPTETRILLSRKITQAHFAVLSDDKLDEFVVSLVCDLVKELWTHEMHEWLRLDGELVTNPHAVDHDDRTEP